MIKQSMQNGAHIDSKIDLFLDPLWRCLATSILGRLWGRVGVQFGIIWGSKIGLKGIGKNSKKRSKKVTQEIRALQETWPVVP